MDQASVCSTFWRTKNTYQRRTVSSRGHTYEPQLYPGRSADVEEAKRMSTLTQGRAVPLMRNLWKHHTNCILHVQISNLDAPSNIHLTPELVVVRAPLLVVRLSLLGGRRDVENGNVVAKNRRRVDGPARRVFFCVNAFTTSARRPG